MISAIKDFLDQDWNIEINHVYRKNNRCAYKLAKMSHRLPLDLTFYDNLSVCIFLEYLATRSGFTSSRFVDLV